MAVSDSTGGSSSSYGLAAGRAVWARLWYLSFNMLFILANLLIGFLVYERTKSLTIEVDYMSFSCEFLAVAINIGIEVVKRRSPGAKAILRLDLAGGLSSLFLLLCVGIFGVYKAVDTTEDLVEGKGSPPASHLDMMVRYSAFSLTLSVVNLCIFGALKEKMLPRDGDVHDQLNILSNLAHSLVDFVTNFAVLGTSLWLQYGVAEENWFEMRKHKAWVDVFGSFMVCACILVSIIWLLRDIKQGYDWISEMPDDDEAVEPVEGVADYGTLHKVGAKPLSSES